MTTPRPAVVGPFTELDARRLGPVRRFFARRPVAMDVLVMALFFVPAAIEVLVVREVPVAPTLSVLTAATVALWWRRRRPVLVAGVVTALAALETAWVGIAGNVSLAVALMLYAVAAARPPRVAWTTAGAAMLTTAAALWLWLDPAQPGGGFSVESGEPPFDERLAPLTGLLILALAAMAIGTSVRNRRMHVADLLGRANALARDRDRQAQLARVAERTRIAREMHDVVAHSLSVMVALADGAAVAVDRSPDRARTALTELSGTGRSALADMRRVLGVLQDADAPLEPQPGADDLVTLVERFRTAGLPVRTSGLSTALPDDAGLQLTVFRIVQESLTNVLRHAAGTPRVDLEIERTPDAVVVDVRDHGPIERAADARDPGGTGRGLIGMAERVAVYGGTVDAGPWDGGWRVRATLPWRGGSGGSGGSDGGTTDGGRA